MGQCITRILPMLHHGCRSSLRSHRYIYSLSIMLNVLRSFVQPSAQAPPSRQATPEATSQVQQDTTPASSRVTSSSSSTPFAIRMVTTPFFTPSKSRQAAGARHRGRLQWMFLNPRNC
ncbi:uncharacterized protein LOC125381994 [Haliotis rufescens]|uniref:uncharacterized protein LOC125381994 n=1 Tax=Haliotis rufescens TaxID=6454 RepID=UPI00201F4C32|nr:uncharacterized protein LOC125381994 [Haliotis rufescens]